VTGGGGRWKGIKNFPYQKNLSDLSPRKTFNLVEGFLALVVMSNRPVAPIDAYWALMEADKFAEAGELLEMHPDDPKCLLEMGMRAPDTDQAGPYWRRAVELGNPVAMAYLGHEIGDLDLLEKAQTSYSKWARAVAFQFLPPEEGLDMNEVSQVMDLYMEALEDHESPRVAAAFMNWTMTLGLEVRWQERMRKVMQVVGCIGANAGVPLGIIKWASLLLDDEETPERNKEIVNQLNRPAVRCTPEAARLLCRLYTTSCLSRNVAKAASISLSMPSKYNGEKISALAKRLQSENSRGCTPDDLLRETCMYGRALALGKMGLPAIPDAFDPLAGGSHLVHLPFGQLFRLLPLDPFLLREKEHPAVNCHLLYYESRGYHVNQVDWKLHCLAKKYRAWIKSVRDAVCEFILVARVTSPSLPRAIARVIARMVWDSREEDIPLWWEQRNHYYPLHDKVPKSAVLEMAVEVDEAGGILQEIEGMGMTVQEYEELSEAEPRMKRTKIL